MNKPITFKDIESGQLFRLAAPELIRRRGPWMPPYVVFDAGVFVKIGNSHAVRVQSGMTQKTIIPGHNVLCTPVQAKHDTSRLEDWDIINGKAGRK